MKLLVLACTIICLLTVLASEPVNADNSDWWKHAIFYQIYPRSFRDVTNDGIGDLLGVIEKLPYLSRTGINAIWLSPIFESPQVDQGYDISNYTKVDPAYGTIYDLKALINLAHSLGIKVILDFVPNHTSDKHQWFINSENGVEGYEDYYVWVDPKKDENGNNVPPNNWVSVFKGPAWTWSENRQKYYLHQFAAAQPDLNYRNPKVVEEMKGVLRYWLDNGVDGFRVDAVPHIIEAEDLADEHLSGCDCNPTDYEYLVHNLTTNQPGTYEIIYDWRDFLDQYTLESKTDQRIFMTEAYGDVADVLRYYGSADGSRLGAHFSFNFDLINKLDSRSNARDLAASIKAYLAVLPENFTPNWVLGNHDKHRIATRLGPQKVDGLNSLLALLPGVAVTYNGEEIGQENGEVSFEEGQDPSARDPEIFDQVSRDFERTPFQWDSTINAGFNEGAKPWLPVSKKYLETNLALQDVEGLSSHYNVYKTVMGLRYLDDLVDGATRADALNDMIFALKRGTNVKGVVLLFNLGIGTVIVDGLAYLGQYNTVLASSTGSLYKVGDQINDTKVELQPYESVVFYSTWEQN